MVQGVPPGDKVVVMGVVVVVVVVGGRQHNWPRSHDQPGYRRQLNVPGGQILGRHGEVIWQGSGGSCVGRGRKVIKFT